jgi:PBP1b-binding outer membrane lipoprotein LpoB
MKKILMVLATLILLAACSSEETSKKESKEDTAKKDESVEVDKKLFNVEVTLPASMFEDESLDTIKAEAKENGIKEVTKNEDGSITYKMSKSTHKKMLKEISASIDETIEETKTSEDFVSIKDITHNGSFSEFTMVVNKEKYENSMDAFATMSLGMSGMLYQMYDGVSEDEYSVTINVEDETTGETFGEVVYPDDLEEKEQG